MTVFATVLAIAISGHASTAHVGQKYSSMDIYDIFSNKFSDPGKDQCKQFIAAYCPIAANPLSGRVNPHLKLFCRINGESPESGMWIEGIIGTSTAEGIFVTGFVTRYKSVVSTIERDKCAPADLTFVAKFFR